MKKTMISFIMAALTALPAMATTHDGKESMATNELRIAAAAVADSISEVELIMETAAAESMGGKFAVPYRLKGQHGIFQITKTSAEDTLKWLICRKPANYEFIMSFFDNQMSFRDNLEYNVEFSAAVCLAIYKRMAPRADITTRMKRAALWKRVYNTSAGAGTTEAYLARCAKVLED